MTYRRYRTIPPWRRTATFFALLLVAVGAAATTRADEAGSLNRPARIEPGVSIGVTPVGGMTYEQAAAAVQQGFDRPLAVTIRRQSEELSPGALGGLPLAAALVARPPVLGGKVASVDDAEALKVPGVVKVVQI